jgi:OmcA/MtrC family decaheme c-type cytochrome
MSLLPRGLALVVFSTGALLVPSSRPIPVSTAGRDAPPVSREGKYTPLNKEFYLAADQVGYVRPGLKIGILSVTNVAPGKKPVVEIAITDGLDQPLDRLGKVTPGPATPSFVLARWDPDSRTYFAYTQRTRSGALEPSTDQNGTWTELEIGHYKYTFGTTLPADFDVTKMLTLAVQARRVMPAEVLDGKTYWADNVFKDFRADGGTPSPVWDKINTATACNNCHNPLALHGGTRRNAKMCSMCHQPQHPPSETGESFDLKVMIHRIHRGENLPSVKAGEPFILTGTHDYSTVALPQDIRNCSSCHEGTDPAKKPSQSDAWYTRPSRAACGSCHDDVDFATGAGHPAGAQVDDSKCSTCHVPEGDAEWDTSIKGAHTVPDKSKQLKGLNAEIISVDQAAPGKKPVVTFKLTNGDGTILDPKPFGTSLNIVLGGPTSDYTLFPVIRERADGAVFNGTVGTYTFTNAIPADASGTWTFSIEARRTVTLNPAPQGGPATYSEGAFNPIKYVAVSGGTAKPRRTLVSLDKCNKCHNRLASLFSHGGQRINLELCVVCHNPNHSDVARRPASAGKPESGAFKRMIHRIHTGEELTQEYTIYGFGSNPTNFNELRFPGDRRDCLTCHVNAAAYTLPVSPDAVPVVTQRDFFSPQGPGTAACVGCHDNRDVAAHAYLNTVNFPGASGPTEACGTCHGTGADWAVEKVHAR